MNRHSLQRLFRKAIHRLNMLRMRLGIETAYDRILRARFAWAMATLAPSDRTIFEMARYEGLSQVEIAERLGLSVRQVQAGFARALGHIHRALQG